MIFDLFLLFSTTDESLSNYSKLLMYIFLPFQTSGRIVYVWLWNQWDSSGWRTGQMRHLHSNLWHVVIHKHSISNIQYTFCVHFSLQRKEAVALHVKLLDLSNEFLVSSHMPNRIARSAIPEHLHVQFASEGSFIQIGGLHADSPDDLVCVFIWSKPLEHFCLLPSRWRLLSCNST